MSNPPKWPVKLILSKIKKKSTIMVPQTETKAGFKAGVKDYRLTYYTPDYVISDTDILVAENNKIISCEISVDVFTTHTTTDANFIFTFDLDEDGD